MAAAANPRTVTDDDSASMVTASYLSEYHVHTQKKIETLSDFRKKLSQFTDDITRLGTIRKLVHIANGIWLKPIECAMEAINEAGTTEFPFGVRYRTLASANDNDIELVTDQYLPRLLWQSEPDNQIPGSFFLHGICTQVFDLVFFFYT